MIMQHSQKVAARLDTWRRNLIDLTRRNKLLNFRPSKTSTVEVVDEIPQQILKQLLEGETFRFDPIPDDDMEEDESGLDLPSIPAERPRWEKKGTTLRDTTGRELGAAHTDDRLQTGYTRKRLEKNLLRISRLADSSLEEQGVNTLFLALGMLEWYESRDSDVVNKAPLLLVPVTLRRADVSSPFRLTYADEDVVLNPALVEKLRVDFNIELPDLPSMFEDVEVDRLFVSIREAVQNFRRWRLTNDVALGLFSFHKFLMFKDLEVNEKHFHAHSLIRALSGEETDRRDSIGLPAEIRTADLDEEMAPWRSCQVLDADSSQQRAVFAARKGYDLVIEGPPGTGKSQTITNLIAQALADDRTVLFVSEKMAALEVVKTRLESVGLGAFCLELHSHKVAKTAFVAELASSLDHEPEVTGSGQDDLEDLQRLTGELREYVVALHEPFGNLARSPYEAFSRLSELRDFTLPDCGVPDIDSWTDTEFRESLRRLEELSLLLADTGARSAHPLRGLNIVQVGRSERADFDRLVDAARTQLEKLEESASSLCDEFGFVPPRTLGDVALQVDASDVIGRSPGGELSVLQAPEWNRLGSDVEELLTTGERYAELRPQVKECFTDDILDVDVAAEIEAYNTHLDSILRMFKPSFWKVRKHLRSFRRPAYTGKGPELVADLRQADECRRALVSIERESERAQQLFGRRWRGPDSDWTSLRDFAAWVVELRSYALDELLTERGLTTVSEASVDESTAHELASAARKDLEALQGALKQLADFADADETAGIIPEPSLRLETVRQRLDDFASASVQLRTWAASNQTLAELEDGPASEFAAAALDDVPAEHVARCFERLFLIRWVDLACRERRPLNNFMTGKHEARIKAFRKLDRKSMQIAENRVKLTLDEKRQQLMEKELRAQLQFIQREAGKRSRIRPVRQILRTAPDVIQLIKPCFMMSPLSVAQFADPEKLHFDLLVFDEASQITPADAVGSFIRADQVIVVGDSKQLPPTNFFSSQIDNPEEMDPDEDLDLTIHDDLESILKEGSATAGISSIRLKWHYRSEDESLIRFSNEEFYSDDPLYTFPNAHPGSEERGLKFEFISDGVYEGGGVNSTEAKAVADAVVRHIKEFPNLTLGVGTFGIKQQTLIQDELELRRRLDPSLEFFFARDGEDKFFVKNLENIQGDDRDVIFLSVTYGPDAAGVVRRRFGPINSENGWRRLNVITTRAKKRMHVFSSMRAEDIDITGSISPGVIQLHRYLKYAETGTYPTASVTSQDSDSPFEDAVMGELKARGYKVVPQVGEAGYRIDIGVVDPSRPGRFICGVECDGASYHRAATVRDRDRLRQQVLESRGWDIHRVWSTDWFHDRERQVDRLVRLIETSKERPRSPARSPSPPPVQADPVEPREPAEPDVEEAPEKRPLEEISVPEYRLAETPQLGEADDFYKAPPEKLAEAINRVVRIEGPIHQDELVRRVAACWGLQRAGSRIADRVLSVATSRQCADATVRRDEFFWPAQMERPPVRSRDLDGMTFSSDHICAAEAAEAVRLLLKHRAPLLPEDIVREGTRLLGFKRAGKKLQELIHQAVDHLVDEGELRAGGTGVRLAK